LCSYHRAFPFGKYINSISLQNKKRAVPTALRIFDKPLYRKRIYDEKKKSQKVYKKTEN
jgi:hypothetical protein